MKTALRALRPVLLVLATMAALVGLAYGGIRLLFDRDAEPVCHKGVQTCFYMWMEDQRMPADSRTNSFPNTDGRSADSLAALNEYMGGDPHWATNYCYVPGLWENDPGDLVLLYVNRPTRWTAHGWLPPTIFKDKAWIIVPVDFTHGERRTIEFIRDNQRPNWEAVVAEHTRFLNSLDQRGR
jgi:hypothetical protein